MYSASTGFSGAEGAEAMFEALLSLSYFVLVPGILWVFYLRHRRLAAESAGSATCGQCGYALRGTTAFECPECGADLREVGMKPPRDPNKGRAVLIFITVMFGIVVVIFAVLYLIQLP